MADLQKLGRYELRSVLGKGAMGVVYEGFDPTLDRRVAVKTILKSVVLDEETERSYSARFAREAKAVGRLNHPHIVQVYDFGEDAEVAYIVMEFIEGRELRACFEARDRFDPAESVRIMVELLDALHVAHESGVIHRDIKPANVMLDAQRRVKLADFGVARVQDGNDRSKGGTMVGTPAFMSPEQVSGARVDRRTDIFSAGIVLYQLLTGEEPFKGEGAWTVAKRIMQDEPPRPSTISTRVSPVFDQIVNRALAKKPDQRFASAKDFSAALQEALAGGSAQRGSDAEIEFWRSIQNSSDAAEYEVYLKEFPAGVYAELARIKISKLPRTSASAPALRDTEEVKRLAEETARLEAELAQREAAYEKREAEAEAKRLAEAQARAEAETRREAEAQARAAAEEKARLAAIEKAQQEAKAEVARREAEIRQRETEFRRREAEAAASAAAAAKADAEATARREAEERARRDADARARAEAQEHARKQAEDIARRRAAIKQREADLKRLAALAPRAKLPVLQLAVGFALVAGAVIGAWYWTTSSDEARLAQLTVALEAATKATQDLNLARERQQELRKRVEVAQLAEDEARAKGDQAKLKELQEQTKRAEAEAQKQNELVKQREAEAKKAGDAAKVADAQKQSDAAKAAEKVAQEKAAQEKAAVEKLAAEKAAAEKAAAEKAAAEKLAAEKALAEKRAAERSATAKSAASQPDGVFPGRYTFRMLPAVGSEVCGRIDVQEDIEIRAGSSQSVSGKDFRDLRFQSAPADSVAATLQVSTRMGNGDVKLTGRATAAGHAGTYVWRAVTMPGTGTCTGQWSLAHKGSKEADKSAAPEKAPPVNVSAAAPEGVRPGRYALHIMIGTGLVNACDHIDVQEDIEVRVGSADGISGAQFTGLRFRNTRDGLVEATLHGGSTSIYGAGDYKLAGRATANGYAGTYEWRGAGPNGCTGRWTLMRKVSAPEGVLPGRYAFRIGAGSGIHRHCGSIDLQEDIEIPGGSAQGLSGKDFTDLRFQSTQDGSLVATLRGVSVPSGSGDIKLAGRATANGYSGTYEYRFSVNVCTGQWALARK